MHERNALEDQLNAIGRIEQELDDQLTMIELGEAEKDDKTVAEAEAALKRLKAEVARRELEALLSGEADANDCYLEVHAGAGGTESQDWASMLMRMYVRWAEQHGYKVEWIEETEGEGAGIKSATVQIKGHNAYGWLKSENGVHRLVRISPFDSNARRHTSFASVVVYPVVDDRIKIDINENDVRTDIMRSGGAGGQHVNKTESAVRLTHIPTNIVVKCQQDRSQHRNRAMAWDMLRAKLFEAEMKKREEKADRRAGRQDRYRLGPPDPLLRAAALSDGEGPAHRRVDLRHRRRARRRSRPVHAGGAGAEGVRRRAGAGRGRGVARYAARSLDRSRASRRAQLPSRDARAQEFLRIDRLAVDARLVMQMRAGRAAGRADLADGLADPHRLADLDVDLRQVAVAGGEAVAVVDLDHLAVAAFPAGDASRCRWRWRAPDRRCRRANRCRCGSPGRPRNGSMRMPNGELISTSPMTGLRTGTATSVW